MKKIYVICPYGLVTGGPDALHQLVYYLNKSKNNAYIVYCDIKTHNYEIPKPYQIYVDNYLLLDEIDDNKNNILITPETLSEYINNYSKLKKYIWWLSVDNDIRQSGFKNKFKLILSKVKLKNLKKLYKINTLKNVIKHKKYNFSSENKDIIHLCASYYAYDYVGKNCSDESRVKLFIEPISKIFLDKSNYCTKNKKNIVLYNPKKNNDFTQKIIKKIHKYKFVPLTGYSQLELIKLYNSAKLYIDFGYFPGAERIPKEAVINGCCILTGKYGAAAYYGDVPIDDEYKIDAIDENVDKITEKIDYMISNYSKIIDNFLNYKNTVYNLEDNFIKQIQDIF